MIKYRTRSDKIEALEIERETDKQVVLPAKNGCRSYRENKVSDWSNWHDTWEAAHAFLVEKAERDIDSLHTRIERAKERLERIKGMTHNDQRVVKDSLTTGGVACGSADELRGEKW